MRRLSVRELMAVNVAWVLAFGSTALAETKTYCDDKCNLDYCTYTCCHITWNGPIASHIDCSSSGCCAHPHGSVMEDRRLPLPGKVIEGVSGPISLAVVGIEGIDASKIVIESDPKTKTVTIRGAVKSASERHLVGATARRQAKGYKVVNQLEITKE